jgi:hypothetical protein
LELKPPPPGPIIDATAACSEWLPGFHDSNARAISSCSVLGICCCLNLCQREVCLRACESIALVCLHRDSNVTAVLPHLMSFRERSTGLAISRIPDDPRHRRAARTRGWVDTKPPLPRTPLVVSSLTLCTRQPALRARCRSVRGCGRPVLWSGSGLWRRPILRGRPG